MAVTGGDESLVNTYGDKDQSGPSVAMLADGGWIVTWYSLSQDGDDWGVYQQRYGGSGAPLGSETRVNSTTDGVQFLPKVCALDDGGWVVVWSGDDNTSSNQQRGVFMQRYDSSGSAVGGQTTVSALSATKTVDPNIVSLDDGGWLVSWTSGAADGAGVGIVFARYDESGSQVGGIVNANSDTTGDQDYSSVASLADGGYVVTYTSQAIDGDSWGIAMRRFDSDGLATGNSLVVNSVMAGSQLYPRIAALEDGGWIVVWRGADDDSDGDGSSIHLVRYSSEGIAGSEVQVNTVTAGTQTDPCVTGLTNGGWVVAWGDYGNDGGGYGVYFQVYDADGNKVGDTTLANIQTDWWQYDPAIAALPDGKFVISWSSDKPDGSDSDIIQRVYDSGIPDPPPGGGGNSPPVATDDKASVGEYAKVKIDVLANDTDADGDAIAVAGAKILKGGGKVTVNADGTITYDAAAGHFDIDKGDKATVKIHYSISDGETGSSATVTVTVNGVSTTLEGTAKANVLDGGKGQDIIDGLGGKDTITGKGGADILIGGGASDTFVFAKGSGKDMITDFAEKGAAHDVIDLSAFASITGFSDLKAHHMTQLGSDVLIDALKGDTILLKNVEIGDLGKGDFIL